MAHILDALTTESHKRCIVSNNRTETAVACGSRGWRVENKIEYDRFKAVVLFYVVRKGARGMRVMMEPGC